ncbi:Slp family lipoprotein [Salmonella enterica]|nr:Slp family lipoprotein [Salmonella enterica]
MNMNGVTKKALMLTMLLSLAACNSIPQNIKGNNQPDIQKNFISIHNQPGLYKGQQARFGGKVINVINTKDDTILEIAVLPLNSYAKPQIGTSYQGRILAQQKGFLDPINYRNHFVTILGTIQGDEQGFIDKVPYDFVKVKLQGIQIWHLTDSVNTTYNLWDYGYGPFWPEPGWGVPYYTNSVTQVTPELIR